MVLKLESSSKLTHCVTHNDFSRHTRSINEVNVNEIMLPFDDDECRCHGQLLRLSIEGALFYNTAHWKTHGTQAAALAHVVKQFSTARLDFLEQVYHFKAHIAFDDDALPWSHYVGKWNLTQGPCGEGCVWRHDGSFAYGSYTAGRLDRCNGRRDTPWGCAADPINISVLYNATQTTFFFGVVNPDDLNGIMLDCQTSVVTMIGTFVWRNAENTLAISTISKRPGNQWDVMVPVTSMHDTSGHHQGTDCMRQQTHWRHHWQVVVRGQHAGNDSGRSTRI
jgi:hypothetical protein